MDTAFFRYRHHPLGEEVARALYGSILKSSVSRLEQYASCAYSYFLEYGLTLKERELFGFEAVDMGMLFHGIWSSFPGFFWKTARIGCIFQRNWERNCSVRRWMPRRRFMGTISCLPVPGISM